MYILVLSFTIQLGYFNYAITCLIIYEVFPVLRKVGK